MDLAEEIRKRTASVLAGDQFIVDVRVSARQRPLKIFVTVDGDKGVGIDDCALISRNLSKLMDEGGVVDDNYTLEVSTPGVDQPLKLKRQYYKNLGRKMKISIRDQVVEGTLASVTDDAIELEQQTGSGKKKEKTTVSVPFSSIEKAFVLISFN